MPWLNDILHNNNLLKWITGINFHFDKSGNLCPLFSILSEKPPYREHPIQRQVKIISQTDHCVSRAWPYILSFSCFQVCEQFIQIGIPFYCRSFAILSASSMAATVSLLGWFGLGKYQRESVPHGETGEQKHWTPLSGSCRVPRTTCQPALSGLNPCGYWCL